MRSQDFLAQILRKIFFRRECVARSPASSSHHSEYNPGFDLISSKKSSHFTQRVASTSSLLIFGSSSVNPTRMGQISFSITPSRTKEYRYGATSSMWVASIPSSKRRRRFAASTLDSFSAGWPQTLLDHTKGHVFFVPLLCWSNN